MLLPSSHNVAGQPDIVRTRAGKHPMSPYICQTASLPPNHILLIRYSFEADLILRKHTRHVRVWHVVHTEAGLNRLASVSSRNKLVT